jgi:hypothetical protein
LRTGYYKALEAGIAATDEKARADAEREKRLILAALRDRGTGVAE